MERAEMAEMSKASEIHHNIFLGCTQDAQEDAAGAREYDIVIECTDHGKSPRPEDLDEVVTKLSHGRVPQRLEFPASGGVVVNNWSHNEMSRIMDFCGWLYRYTHGDFGSDSESVDSDGDHPMKESSLRSQTHKVLITCNDGYTETSMLALAYTMYAKAFPTHKAWLYLHKNKGRNFFAYPDDLRLLRRLQSALLQRSPASPPVSPGLRVKIPDPRWALKMDGSFPSRILPHLYLGNLDHANNYQMLHELGIHQVLSIGEPVSWSNDNELGIINMCIDGVQDNGMDSLTKHIKRCLAFIEAGKEKGLTTLVHCRVGVSRSATICIAEVMKTNGWNVAKS
jgi:dual specificity MAP kinase phosphatase